jgi:hypothetical protein
LQLENLFLGYPKKRRAFSGKLPHGFVVSGIKLRDRCLFSLDTWPQRYPLRRDAALQLPSALHARQTKA